MDRAAVLAAHDEQVRRDLTAPPGYAVEDLGAVVRRTAPAGSGGSFIEWSAVDEATADAEIARQVAWFRDRGQAFEWKTYGRDAPGDLGARLVDAGFVAGGPEAFVVGAVPDVVAATDGHDVVDGVEIRPALRDDLAGMGVLSTAVWGDPATGMFSALLDEREHDPAGLELLLAIEDGVVLCHGWVRLPRAEFASLWGGTTHPDHRGRGIYRALVRRRALMAAERGHRWLQVDCTDDSRPILERLGMVAIDTTTPYRWRPAAHQGR
jgi:GNAT superfamily N-acetyltransferase